MSLMQDGKFVNIPEGNEVILMSVKEETMSQERALTVKVPVSWRQCKSQQQQGSDTASVASLPKHWEAHLRYLRSSGKDCTEIHLTPGYKG